jgi:predicted nucleic acid-binding protein
MSRMAAVVSDSSVLIGLAAIRQFGLLPLLYDEVLVPDAVWREVASSPPDSPGSTEATAACAAGWLNAAAAINRPLVTQLEATLDPGEAEAIALAVEREPSLLLIDESDGRRVARTMGVSLTGTIGVLLRAKAKGHFTALKPLLDELIERHHFRLHRDLYRQVLSESGELP